MKFCLYILAFTLISFQLHAKNKSPESPKIAYLGVYVSKVNPNVSHQLKLSQNLYLSVERVEKGSPAEKAGIQQFDILLQLDDQILINPDQLKYLVRSKKPKDEVSLHFLSRGDKKNTTLVLGGIIQPIEDVVKLAKKYGCLVHCDAAQALGKIKIDLKKVDLDFLTLSGHKIVAPSGIGALVNNTNFNLGKFFVN